ncbi:MAG: MBL fold metallo-hydrolase [Candidatus Hadarchaeales archaeon]
MRVGEGLGGLARLKLSRGELGFVHFEFSALAVSTADHRLLFDPAELVRKEDLSVWRPHLFLITHEHFDHLEPSHLVELQRASGGTVVCNAGSYHMLKGKVGKLVQLKAGGSAEVEGARVTGIGAEHPAEDPLMFLVESGGLRIFHGSDSSFTPEVGKHRADVAFVPAGMPSPTASVEDALRMAKDLGCRLAVPFHCSPDEAEEFGRRAGKELPGVKVVLPEPGKVYKV